MTDNTKDALRKSLKNAIFAIPDEQLISRDIIIAAIDAALPQTPVAVDEREEFERLYRWLYNYSCHVDSTKFDREGDGYKDACVQVAWTFYKTLSPRAAIRSLSQTKEQG